MIIKARFVYNTECDITLCAVPYTINTIQVTSWFSTFSSGFRHRVNGIFVTYGCYIIQKLLGL